MPRLIFELSMPSNNSWNGKWSGENNKYTVARKVSKKRALELEDYYHYNFGDGWAAGVSVREANPRERATNKFCGYEWMIDSIIDNGKITTL